MALNMTLDMALNMALDMTGLNLSETFDGIILVARTGITQART